MKTLTLLASTVAVGALLSLTPAPAKADLVFDGFVAQGGTGLGAVPTILTMNGKGSSTEESEKVSWVCQFGNCSNFTQTDPTGVGGPLTGGAFTAPDSTQSTGINNTVAMTDTGWVSGDGLGIVFNPAEPNGGGKQFITLNQLQMTIYNSLTGAVLFTAPWLGGPMTLDASTNNGTGNSGYLFSLNQAESDELNASGVGLADRIGLFAYASDAQGGNETFFGSIVAETPCDNCVINPVSDPVPEPGSLALMGTSLIGFFGFTWYRRRDKSLPFSAA